MTDFVQALASLRRPRLLIRAARYGVEDYNRKRDFRRITRGEEILTPDRAVRKLMDIEADLERSRKDGEATYSPSRHVDTLIALMAEARMLLRPTAVA